MKETTFWWFYPWQAPISDHTTRDLYWRLRQVEHERGIFCFEKFRVHFYQDERILLASLDCKRLEHVLRHLEAIYGPRLRQVDDQIVRKLGEGLGMAELQLSTWHDRSVWLEVKERYADGLWGQMTLYNGRCARLRLQKDGISEQGPQKDGISEHGLQSDEISEHGLGFHGLREYDMGEIALPLTIGDDGESTITVKCRQQCQVTISFDEGGKIERRPANLAHSVQISQEDRSTRWKIVGAEDGEYSLVFSNGLPPTVHVSFTTNDPLGVSLKGLRCWDAETEAEIPLCLRVDCHGSFEIKFI